MGIHNSFRLLTVWRVANQTNMKAFVTLCSVLAGTAAADSQYIQNVVPLSQPLGVAPLVAPYGVYSAPLSPVSVAKVVDLQLESSLPYSTMLIKRDAEPNAPYVYQAKVDNPEDGSKYEIGVQVDRFGHGQSHQQIERQPTFGTVRDNYLMGQRMAQNRNDLRQSNQMRTENRQMGGMMPGENVMGQKQRTTYRMDGNMMSQGMRNQMVRDQDQMASGMYTMMDQRQRENMNQRMQEMRRRSGNAVDRGMMDSMAQPDQMQSRRMIKRDADPSFQYTVASGHPASQSQYRMGQNMRDQSQYRMGNMRDQVFGDGLMNNQRLAHGRNLGRTNTNLVNQMVRGNLVKSNQMHSRGIIKREADSFMAYNLPSNYMMPYVGYQVQVPSMIGYPHPAPVYMMA